MFATTDPVLMALPLGVLAGRVKGARRRKIAQMAVKSARAIHDERAQAETLIALAALFDSSSMRQSLLQEARVAAQCTGGGPRQIHILIEVAGHLIGPERRSVLDEALDGIQFHEDEDERADVLRPLVAQLEPDQLDRALAHVRQLTDDYVRVRLLIGVADRLTGPAQQRMLEEALSIALGIESEQVRAEMLGAFVDRVDDRRKLTLLLDGLLSFQHAQRRTVFTFFNNPAWFNTPYMPRRLVYSVIDQVAEICTQWQWM